MGLRTQRRNRSSKREGITLQCKTIKRKPNACQMIRFHIPLYWTFLQKGDTLLGGVAILVRNDLEVVTPELHHNHMMWLKYQHTPLQAWYMCVCGVCTRLQ